MSNERTKTPNVNGLPVLSRSDFKSDEDYHRYVQSFIADLMVHSPNVTVEEVKQKRKAAGLPEVDENDILVLDLNDPKKKVGHKIAKFLGRTGLGRKKRAPFPEND